MDVQSSTNARSTTWQEVAQFVIDGIEENWFNAESDETDRAFITKQRLSAIWRDTSTLDDEAFVYLCGQHRISFNVFLRTTICLVSALVYYSWNPYESDCILQEDGLSVPGLPGLLTDSNIPLDLTVIRQIFGQNKISFKEGQLAFKPAELRDDGFGFCRFPQGTRLPFEFLDNKEQRNGFYGEVRRVRVLTGYLYHGAKPQLKQVVACKTITHSRMNFQQEVNNLVLIGRNTEANEHVVTHIMAIIVAPNRFHILFPWAWTDLADLFRKDPSRYPEWLSQSAVSPRNLLDEAGYLGLALDFLHERIETQQKEQISLFHMDFKPDNILVFRPETPLQERTHPLGLWKITDFGVSDARKTKIAMGDVIDSLGSPSPDRPLDRRSGPYQAPEIEGRHQFRDYTVDHAKADVFSYGCVLAEILAFAIGGPPAHQALKQALSDDKVDTDGHYRDQYFFRVVAGRQFVLAPALISFFESSLDSPTPWHLDVWHLIKEKTLCIEPIQRLTARDCRQQLNECSRLVPSVPLLRPQRKSIQPPASSYAHRDSRFEDELSINSILDFDARSEISSSSKYTVLSESEIAVNSARPELPVRYLTDMHSQQVSSSASRAGDQGGNSHASPVSTARYPTAFQSPTRGHTFPPGISFPPSRRPSDMSPSVSNSPDATLSPHLIATTQATDFLDRCSSHDTGEPFSDHLRRSHFKSSMVFSSSNGQALVFSDGLQLCRARLTAARTLECISLIKRRANTPILAGRVKLSESCILAHETNNTLSVHRTGISGPLIEGHRLNHAISGRDILRFDIATDGRVAVEFRNTIEVYDFDVQRLLWYQKKTDPNFADLVFDSDGEAVFGVCRDKFLQWRFDTTQNAYINAWETCHLTVSETSQFRPILIPLAQASIILLQMQNDLKLIYYIKDSFPKLLQYTAGRYEICGRMHSALQGDMVFCLGRQKYRKKFVLILWNVLVSSDGVPSLSLAQELPTTFTVHSMKSTDIACRSDGDHVMIVEANGEIQRLPLR